jgi:Cu-Zn family superoxide dismutase
MPLNATPPALPSTLRWAAALGTALLLGACGSAPDKSAASSTGAPATAAQASMTTAPAGRAIEAVARLQPTQGSQVSGSLRFIPQGDGSVRVQGMIQGLAPNSEHGFHVHEKGDCSSPDGLSAGGHFNPTGQAHGRFDSAAHHTGDLPSLKADAQGRASVDFISRGLALDQGPTSVLGRGLIVHKDPDDYTTQPTGNSGARLACAVIQRGA